MDDGTVLHEADGVHGTATWRNHFITIWRDKPEVSRVRRFEAALQALKQRYPNGIGFWVLMETSTPMPDAEVRKEAARILRGLGTSCRFQVIVYGAQGPIASLLRATIGAVSVMASGHPVKLVRTLEEGAAWAVEKLPGEVSPAEMVKALEAVRRAYARATGEFESDAG